VNVECNAIIRVRICFIKISNGYCELRQCCHLLILSYLRMKITTPLKYTVYLDIILIKRIDTYKYKTIKKQHEIYH